MLNRFGVGGPRLAWYLTTSYYALHIFGAKGLYMAFTMSISIFQTQIRIWLWFGKDNSYPYLSNSATVTDMNQTWAKWILHITILLKLKSKYVAFSFTYPKVRKKLSNYLIEKVTNKMHITTHYVQTRLFKTVCINNVWYMSDWLQKRLNEWNLASWSEMSTWF